MTTLKVQKRDTEKKAKALRREGFVTGTLFGKNIKETVLLQIEKKEAERIHRECFKGSQLNLELDGKKYDVLLKEVDYDGLKREIYEMDFQALVKGEKVHSVAEIVLHNRDNAKDGIVEQLLSEISYKATPENLVDKIEVDCATLKLGDVLKVSDLPIAKNKKVDIQTNLDAPVVSVVAPHNAPVTDTEASEGTVTAEVSLQS
ncbi:MAG: 50S ribosomal protein L25 [Lachnospiraceae bacterium]|nr:50S ribosomal protein L25 [Lachnospiraceae bacterium]